MSLLSLLSLLPALTGCQSSDVAVRNNQPEAVVLWPTAETPLTGGQLTPLLGAVSDTNDFAEDLTAAWYAGDTVLCEPAPVEPDGTTRCEATFDAGEVGITLEVTDPADVTGTADVLLDVRPNAPPAVQFLSPTADSAQTADALIVVEALISDAETPLETLTLAWTDGDGAPLSIDDAPDTDGSLLGTLRLPAGTHTVTLSVTDTAGATGTASVTLNVEG